MSDLINNLTYVEIPKDVAYAVGELFGYYLIPITACVASAINLTFCRAIVINSKFMRRRKYRLLLAKAFIVGLHGILMAGFQNANCSFCKERLVNTYKLQVWNITFRWISQSLWISCGFFEVVVCYDRYKMLYSKSRLKEIPVKFIFLGLIFFSTLLWIPDYMAIELQSIPHNLEKYTVTYTEFGQSSYYNVYMTGVSVLCCLFIMTSLIVLNTMNVVRYKELITLVSRRRLSIEESMFTRMILITVSWFIATGVLLIISVPVNRIAIYYQVYYHPVINLLRATSFFMSCVHYLFDPIIYLIFDVNLKRNFKKYWRDL